MEATRALIRRGVKRLHLIALPTSSLQADLLIGAGCIATLETSAVSLGEFGPAPRFTAAITRAPSACTTRPARRSMPRSRRPRRRALHASARAHRLGLLEHRPDWHVIDNPFGNDDPIVLLPALKPDVALFHAPLADRDGNVWIGRDRELATMAHAASRPS